MNGHVRTTCNGYALMLSPWMPIQGDMCV